MHCSRHHFNVAKEPGNTHTASASVVHLILIEVYKALGSASVKHKSLHCKAHVSGKIGSILIPLTLAAFDTEVSTHLSLVYTHVLFTLSNP